MTTDEIKIKLDEADELAKETRRVLQVFTSTASEVDDTFKEIREKYRKPEQVEST